MGGLGVLLGAPLVGAFFAVESWQKLQCLIGRATEVETGLTCSRPPRQAPGRS